MILALWALVLAPASALGADSVGTLRDLVTLREPSEKESAFASEGPAGQPERGGGEGQRRRWERYITFSGDARAALTFKDTGQRDGGDLSETIPQVRLRGGVAVSFFPQLGVTARLVLGIDDDLEGFDFSFRHERDIEAGDVTFDELFVTLIPHGFLTIKGGRLQTTGRPFALDSVVGRSLSRRDSGALNIDWTDGGHVIIGRPSSFKLHLIGQANPEEGPTNGVGVRGPLDFEDGASRVTYYGGLEAPPWKPFTQLVADVTIIPQALAPSGLTSETREDVIAFTARAAADFPLPRWQPIVLHPSGEFGIMTSTAQEKVLKVSNSGEEAGRFAFVAGLDVKNLGPGNLGFQFAWTEAGYLISPDHPNNRWGVEARYEVAIAKNVVFDLRYLHRQEIDTQVGARARQTEENVRARVTVKF